MVIRRWCPNLRQSLSLYFYIIYKTLQNKKASGFQPKALNGIVGMAGFEPAASTSQMWRDTGLRYIPFGVAKIAKQKPFANSILKEIKAL